MTLGVVALVFGRADAQSVAPAPPAAAPAIASPADISSAFDRLNVSATDLRTSTSRINGPHKQTTEFASLVKTQAALKNRVENAPVSVEYAQAIALDAKAVARANTVSTQSARRALARPAERDLKAKNDQVSRLDVTTMGEFGDTVTVTVKTLINGAEAQGYFVMANFWPERDNVEPDHIFGAPTPCSKLLMPGFYYFWIDVPGKKRALVEREVSGTGLPPAQTIYLRVPPA